MNLAISTIAAASLPQTYQAARNALAQCQAIDECKDWADKAAALASYARQSEDLELEKMAIRIRERASRRSGELARQMMQPHGTNRFSENRDDGSGISMPKEKVLEISGYSERQLNTALRIANIPEPEFNAQVDSDNPPSMTELARQGTKTRPVDPQSWLKGRDPKTFNAILHMKATIEEYANDSDTWPLIDLVPHFTDEDRAAVRKWISEIDAIHDQIITRI